MDRKEKIIIVLLIAIIIILFGAICLSINDNSDNTINNATNHTGFINNATNNTSADEVNATFASDGEDSYSQNTYSSSDSSDESEPEYGSDEYVKKWDESQQGDGTWAYMHDQPVKTEDGHDYKRMYNPDSGESYWYQMDQNFDEETTD